MVSRLMLTTVSLGLFVATSGSAAVVHRVLKKNQKIILKLSPKEASKMKRGDVVKVKLGRRGAISGVATKKRGNQLTVDVDKGVKKLRLGQMVDLEKALAASDSYRAESYDDDMGASGPSLQLQDSSPSPFSDSFTLGYWKRNPATIYRVSSARIEGSYQHIISGDASSKSDTIKSETKSIDGNGVDVLAVAHVSPNLWLSANYSTFDIDIKYKSGSKVESSFSQMAIGAAYQIMPNLVAGLSLQANEEEDKDGGVKSSESYNRVEPAIIYYIPGDLELGVSYRPTVRIVEAGAAVLQEGYFIVSAEKFLARDATVIGQVEHRRYSKLNEDYKDILEFAVGGTFYTQTGRLTGLLGYQPDYHDDDTAASTATVSSISLDAAYFHTIDERFEGKIGLGYLQGSGDGKNGLGESVDHEIKLMRLVLGGAYKF